MPQTMKLPTVFCAVSVTNHIVILTRSVKPGQECVFTVPEVQDRRQSSDRIQEKEM